MMENLTFKIHNDSYIAYVTKPPFKAENSLIELKAFLLIIINNNKLYLILPLFDD